MRAKKKPDTQTQIDQILAQIKAVKSDVEKTKIKAAKHEKRLKNIQAHEVEKYLDSIREDSENLHKRLQLMITKICVATELHFLAKTIYAEDSELLHLAILDAFDLADDWWQEMQDKSLSEWKNTILEIYQNESEILQ